MKPLGILFPTELERAARDAREAQNMSASQRYESVRALMRTIDSIPTTPERRARLRALHYRLKNEELRALAQVQVRHG